MVGLKFENSSMTSGLCTIYLCRMIGLMDESGDELRPVAFDLASRHMRAGQCSLPMGNTRVICGVTIEENVPRWMKSKA